MLTAAVPFATMPFATMVKWILFGPIVTSGEQLVAAAAMERVESGVVQAAFVAALAILKKCLNAQI